MQHGTQPRIRWIGDVIYPTDVLSRTYPSGEESSPVYCRFSDIKIDIDGIQLLTPMSYK